MLKTKHRYKRLSILVWGIFISGCTLVGPDFKPPVPDIPSYWHSQLMVGLDNRGADNNKTDSPLSHWWQAFNDPLLNRLIERAEQGSLTLKLTYERIAEARARLGVASSQRLPDINAEGSAERDKLSEGLAEFPPPPQRRIDNFTDLGLSASWELDFWGRVRRSIESAEASYQASVEDYGYTLVLLYAEVATNYVLVRTTQQRLRLARDNVLVQRETLKLVSLLKQAGLVPQLDIHQAELNLAVTESILPQLLTEYIQAVNRLGVLIGEHPGALKAQLNHTPIQIPQPPKKVALSLPADWVRQRPDIRLAEYQLAAQTARVGIATSELYPNFFLSGNFSFATASGDLMSKDNTSWSIGPFFNWNLFDGSRVRNRIKVEESFTQQALLSYEQAVLSGLEDVENAITAFTKERFRQASLTRSVIAAERSVKQVKSLYRSGLTNFQNVLDMERSLFNQQDLLAESAGRVTLNLIRVYRAFGGGWNHAG